MWENKQEKKEKNPAEAENNLATIWRLYPKKFWNEHAWGIERMKEIKINVSDRGGKWVKFVFFPGFHRVQVQHAKNYGEVQWFENDEKCVVYGKT